MPMTGAVPLLGLGRRHSLLHAFGQSPPPVDYPSLTRLPHYPLSIKHPHPSSEFPVPLTFLFVAPPSRIIHIYPPLFIK